MEAVHSTSASTQATSKTGHAYSFDVIAKRAVPELSGPSGPAMLALQNFFRNIVQSGGVGSERWLADKSKFCSLIGFQIPAEDFANIATEGYADLREWLIGSMCVIHGISMQAKLRFGFGLFDWKNTGSIDTRAALPRLLRGLQRCAVSMATAEARARDISGSRRSLTLKEILHEAEAEPGIFFKFKDEKEEKVSSFVERVEDTKPRRRGSAENIHEKKNIHEIFDIEAGAKSIAQHHTDIKQARIDRFIGPQKFKFPAMTPAHAVFACQVIGLCLVLALRAMVSSAAIGALMDAIAAFCGFGALVTCGALCLKGFLPVEVEETQELTLDP